MPHQSERSHSGLRRAAVCLAAGVLAACSTSTPTTHEQIGSSRTAIEAAEAAGASDASTPEMAVARDKLARAQGAARAGDNTTARRLGEEAEVDALVARSRAAAERSRKSAQEVDASLAALRDELTRQPPAVAVPTRP